MKVLLIEDDDSKSEEIIAHLKKGGVTDGNIIRAKNMTDFAANLNADISLFIIDFKIPSFDDGSATSNGRAILEAIVKAGKDDALLLAISSYPDDFPDLREKFEAHGCILADYKNTEGWQSTLNHLLIQLRKNIQMDFLIFCALREERSPYVMLFESKSINRGGFNCWDIELAGRKGSVILLPKMGLVNAAITAATCIDRYKPKIVAMSGICGGFKTQAEMGQLLISTMAYEYQSGKWSGDGFHHEPYQVPTNQDLITDIETILDDDDLISDLEKSFRGERPSIVSTPRTGIFTSGSAVIANEDYMKQIDSYHRKVSALDMEIFAIQRAAELSTSKPLCICAKTVVDLCDEAKDDKLHSYGSHISAKFVLKVIQSYFENVRP